MRQCELCKKEFSTKSNLNRHQANINCQALPKKPIIFDCTFCKKILSSKQMLEYHINICKNKQNIKTKKTHILKDINLAKKEKKQLEKDNFKKIQKERLEKEQEDVLKEMEKELLEQNILKRIETIKLKQEEKTTNAAYKKKPIPKILKTHVWYTHIGKQIGMTKCLCCNRNEITQMEFDCGHIIAEKKGGPTNIENLLPICSKCNKSMRTMNMNEFKEKYFTPSKQ